MSRAGGQEMSRSKIQRTGQELSSGIAGGDWGQAQPGKIMGLQHHFALKEAAFENNYPSVPGDRSATPAASPSKKSGTHAVPSWRQTKIGNCLAF